MGANQIKEKNKFEDAGRKTDPRMEWSFMEDSLDRDSNSDPNLFVALYDFRSDGDNQLDLEEGEQVYAANWSESTEWCRVTNHQKLSGYVPTKYLAPWRGLDKYPWFHGPMSRSAAEYLLRSEVEGTFLVRESESTPGQFCISLKHNLSAIHFKITKEDSMFYIVKEKKYASLVDLMKYLSTTESCILPTTLKYLVPRKNKPTIYDTCPGLPGMWELDRSELEMLEKLGSGQYGDVYKARLARLKKDAAVKTLKDAASSEEFVKEAAIMKDMKHPNLIRLLGVCSKRTPLYIVMEFMVNGNLLTFLKSSSSSELTPTILVYMASQICSAMVYLESKNFIHRDLAARNCLVGEDHLVKVADFGMARLIKEDTYMSQASPILPIKWTAPEGLAFSIFSSKSDVWAFGILLYEMVTYGQTPYTELGITEVYPFLERGGRMDRPRDCPKKVYQLMRRCWEWDPEKRPTFKEIQQEFDNMANSNGSFKVKKNQSHQVLTSFSNLTSSEQTPTSKHNVEKKHPSPALPPNPKPKVCASKKDQSQLSPNSTRPLKLKNKSNSLEDSSHPIVTENAPIMSLQNELSQKFGNNANSETTNVFSFLKMSSTSLNEGDSPRTKPKNPSTASLHPPPLPDQHHPTKTTTRQKILPPTPPAKPTRAKQPEASAKPTPALPPLPPFKPTSLNKTITSGKVTKPIPPTKPSLSNISR